MTTDAGQSKMQSDLNVKWSSDFEAAPTNRSLLVWATDDDGFCYGIAGWTHEEGKAPFLAWASDDFRPINDGIERALFWALVPSPGLEALQAAAFVPA